MTDDLEETFRSSKKKISEPLFFKKISLEFARRTLKK